MTARKVWTGLWFFYLLCLPVTGYLAIVLIETMDIFNVIMGVGIVSVVICMCIGLQDLIHDQPLVQKTPKPVASLLPVFPEIPRHEWEAYPLGQYVYVIQDADITRCCKIGRTNHPARRLNRFEVALPFGVRVICILPCQDMVAMEAYLHRRYAHKRHGGEWFSLTEQDVIDICKL